MGDLRTNEVRPARGGWRGAGRRQSVLYIELSGERNPVSALGGVASLVPAKRSRIVLACPSQKTTLVARRWRKPCVPADRSRKAASPRLGNGARMNLSGPPQNWPSPN